MAPICRLRLISLAGMHCVPKEEARSLFAMIGRNGDTVESIRELIAVPANIENALTLYVSQHPEDARGIEKVFSFRKRVREEFDQLAHASVSQRPSGPLSLGSDRTGPNLNPRQTRGRGLKSSSDFRT